MVINLLKHQEENLSLLQSRNDKLKYFVIWSKEIFLSFYLWKILVLILMKFILMLKMIWYLEDKAVDLIHILSLLHIKTTSYQEVAMDSIKEMYEDISKK